MNIIDPRLSIIEERFSKIRRIIAVTGFKGGIGKSVISVALSLSLNEKGFKTGLLDLDFTGASDHIILGVNKLFPREEKGIIPPYINGIKFMTISYFSKNSALPLRGDSVSNAIKELFAITIWDRLDFLVIDMPPGINDTTLDTLKLIKNLEILPICLPSRLSKKILERSSGIYSGMRIKTIGVVENMAKLKKRSFYSQIFYDAKLEQALGNPSKIIKTNFYNDVLKLSSKIILGIKAKKYKISV